MRASANILSIGLGDLVSARNAALRLAGFEVTAAGKIFFGFADQAILTWQLWAMHFPLRSAQNLFAVPGEISGCL